MIARLGGQVLVRPQVRRLAWGNLVPAMSGICVWQPIPAVRWINRGSSWPLIAPPVRVGRVGIGSRVPRTYMPMLAEDRNVVAMVGQPPADIGSPLQRELVE